MTEITIEQLRGFIKPTFSSPFFETAFENDETFEQAQQLVDDIIIQQINHFNAVEKSIEGLANITPDQQRLLDEARLISAGLEQLLPVSRGLFLGKEDFEDSGIPSVLISLEERQALSILKQGKTITELLDSGADVQKLESANISPQLFLNTFPITSADPDEQAAAVNAAWLNFQLEKRDDLQIALELETERTQFFNVSKSIRDAARNSSEDVLISEVIDKTDGVQSDIRGIKKKVLLIEDTAEAVVRKFTVGEVPEGTDLFGRLGKFILGIPSVKSILEDTVLFVAKEAVDFLQPDLILLKEFENVTGIKLIFNPQQNDHRVGHIGNDIFAISDQENAETSLLFNADKLEDLDLDRGLFGFIDRFFYTGSEFANTLDFTGREIGAAESGAGNDVFIIRQSTKGKISGEGDDDTFRLAYQTNLDIDGGEGFDTVDLSDNRRQLKDGGPSSPQQIIKFTEGFSATLDCKSSTPNGQIDLFA